MDMPFPLVIPGSVIGNKMSPRSLRARIFDFVIIRLQFHEFNTSYSTEIRDIPKLGILDS